MVSKEGRGSLIVGFLFVVIIVFSLYFVFAVVAPTGLVFGRNISSVYDEGNFSLNWTAGDADPALNYTLYVYANGVLYLKDWNSSALGYNFNNWTEANYTFRVAALNESGVEGANSSNISIYVDRAAPKWQINSTNNTVAGAQVKHNINWTDNFALAGYIFSFDNGTGSFTNSTWVAMSGVVNWSNVTKGINTTVGTTIQWKVYANDSSSVWNVTSVFSYVTTDATISFDSPTPSNNSNLSQTFIPVNISVTDAVGLSWIRIYLWNATSLVNDTNVSVSGTTNETFLNITGLTDGVYYLNATANDTSGNTNSSVTRKITLDVIAPSLSFSCTPDPVVVGGIVTCACEGSDLTSGLNGYVSFTVHPLASPIGIHTETCTGIDYAGNTGSVSTTYKVSSNVGGGGGGSSSTANFWTKGTYSVSGEQFKQGYSMEVLPKQRLKINAENQEHYVGVKELTSTSAKIEVTSTPQEKILSIGEEWKVELTGDGYYDLNTKLVSITNGKAAIYVKSIHESISQEVTPSSGGDNVNEPAAITGQATEEGVKEGKSLAWLWVILVLLVICLVVWFLFNKRNKKRKYHGY